MTVRMQKYTINVVILDKNMQINQLKLDWEWYNILERSCAGAHKRPLIGPARNTHNPRAALEILHRILILL